MQKTTMKKGEDVDIEIAADAGACYGVKRALELARSAKNQAAPRHTLGPLIHNPIVVAELERDGLSVANTLDEAGSGTLVLRSHGTAPYIVKAAVARGFNVIDATCPYVAKIQRFARELADDGYQIVIIGEPGHAEVEGIRAWGGQAVVAVADEPGRLPETLPKRVGVVIQTTQSAERVDAVLAELRQRCEEVLVKETVCFATQQRQQSAAELSAHVDVMIVIGGHNSGNTRRLVEICEPLCAATHHIERVDEIDDAWFEGADRVGITAGASTPSEQIDIVKEHINAISLR